MNTLTRRLSLIPIFVVLGACSAPPPPGPTPPPSPEAEEKPEQGSAEPAPPPPAPKPEKASLSQIDLSSFFALRSEGKARVYDVRPPIFYRLGHIEGAISLPMKAFDQAFAAEEDAMRAAVSAGKVIVVYCTDLNCPDGHSVGEKLAARGIPTTVYAGGWAEWKEAGLE